MENLPRLKRYAPHCFALISFSRFSDTIGASQAKLLKLEKAADSFKAAISVDPKPDSHLNLASILQKLNDHKNATGIQAAIKLNPGFVEAHCVLGNSLRGEGEYKEAIRAYKKCYLTLSIPLPFRV